MRTAQLSRQAARHLTRSPQQVLESSPAQRTRPDSITTVPALARDRHQLDFLSRTEATLVFSSSCSSFFFDVSNPESNLGSIPLRYKGPGLERRLALSPQISPKVAADIYDSDDANPSRTPPLIPRVVHLRPSPSPEIVPSPANSSSSDRMSRSPRQKGRKRRPKTQASQGDAVLIGFLGGLNLPDVATRAGEEPLNSASQSEADEWTEEMEPDDADPTAKRHHLVQAAQDALLVDGTDDKGATVALENARRVRPKIMTHSLSSTLRNQDRKAQVKLQSKQDKRKSPSTIQTENLDPALGGSMDPHQRQAGNQPASEHRRSPSDTNRSSPLATSPRLRQYMASNGSEILPAIQSATPSLSAKSPHSGPSLPSISAQLGELVDGPSPNESLPTRSTFPMTNGIQSPPMSGISPRPNHYPSPQARLNSFPTPYPAAQPSPASTYSEVSPREPHRTSHELTSMSPPEKPGPPYYTTSRPSQMEELTPQSAESHAGFKCFSPNGDHPDVEPGRPILPPLPGSGPLPTGNFRCNFPGCTATPFQTQYLLKYASSPPFPFSQSSSRSTTCSLVIAAHMQTYIARTDHTIAR
ncbi:MAG: hypothetical protein Q9219_002721 [cf. Caloplaca sp. 3 TL-2023]